MCCAIQSCSVYKAEVFQPKNNLGFAYLVSISLSQLLDPVFRHDTSKWTISIRLLRVVVGLDKDEGRDLRGFSCSYPL